MFGGIKFRDVIAGAAKAVDEQLKDDIERTKNYRLYFKEFCKKKCVNFFDYFDDFEKLILDTNSENVIKEYYFYGDMHFNEKGNKIIANKLLKNLN